MPKGRLAPEGKIHLAISRLLVLDGSHQAAGSRDSEPKAWSKHSQVGLRLASLSLAYTSRVSKPNDPTET